MDIEVIGNRLEAGLWLLVASLFGCHIASRWFRKVAVPGYVGLAGAAFAIFGVSDVIESYTGAWWTPWWLFAMKAICVLVFAYCFQEFRRAKVKGIIIQPEPMKPPAAPAPIFP